jgi:NAD(P)-dependent dehydrogenase (short-subunit alcohol dehydrogenase family)
LQVNKNFTTKEDKNETVKRKSRHCNRIESRIGLAIVKQFAAQGAIVYAFDIKDDAKYDEGVTFLRHDVTQEEEWKVNLLRVVKAQGRVDILVNNAGLISYTPVHELEMDGID